MDMSSTLVTGAMAMAFVLVHLFVGKLRFLAVEPRSAWLSFAGGVAVGYVFLHILPELAAHGTTFRRAIGLPDLLAESLVYALSLIGLVLFYGLERALRVSRSERRVEGGRDRPHWGVFRLHVAASALLIFIVSYLLNHREDDAAVGLALFFLAILLHFVTADFGTRSDHPEMYDREGRWVLSSATIAGWVTGLFVELPELAIGCLFAFVAGGIVLLVLKEELPEDRGSRFAPFLTGAIVFAALVLGEQWLASG